MTNPRDPVKVPGRQQIRHEFMTHEQAIAAGEKLRSPCIFPTTCHFRVPCLDGGSDFCGEEQPEHSGEVTP